MILVCHALLAIAAATAPTSTGPYGHDRVAPSPLLVAQAESAMTAGEVRKVDKQAKKITLKHAEIKNLGMPPMTMVFQVKDPAMLDGLKPGDRVLFKAEQVGGNFVIDTIERDK